MKYASMEFAAVVLALFATSAALATANASPLRVEHGWIRWLPANLPAAGYAVIENNGNATATLTGVESPDYAMIMLHRSVQKNGSDTMQMVDRLTIPAHGKLTLAPGGYHLMLMQAKHPIKPGDSVHIALHFADGETLQVTWPVRPANASGG